MVDNMLGSSPPFDFRRQRSAETPPDVRDCRVVDMMENKDEINISDVKP